MHLSLMYPPFSVLRTIRGVCSTSNSASTQHMNLAVRRQSPSLSPISRCLLCFALLISLLFIPLFLSIYPCVYVFLSLYVYVCVSSSLPPCLLYRFTNLRYPQSLSLITTQLTLWGMSFPNTLPIRFYISFQFYPNLNINSSLHLSLSLSLSRSLSHSLWLLLHLFIVPA